MTLSMTMLYHYSERRILFTVMLNVIMLSVMTLLVFTTVKSFIVQAHKMGATTLSIMTFTIQGSFSILSITAFSINDTQHNSTSAIMLRVIILNVAFYLLLC